MTKHKKIITTIWTILVVLIILSMVGFTILPALL
mgnify:CR=1 FL=1